MPFIWKPSHPVFVAVIGKPLSGKKTSHSVFEAYGAPVVTSSSAIKEAISAGAFALSENPRMRNVEIDDLLTKTAKQMEDGQLVKDDIVIASFEHVFLARLDMTLNANMFGSDGYPRTVAQVEAIRELIGSEYDFVPMILHVSDDTSRQRRPGRMIEELRSDDAADKLERRLQVYAKEFGSFDSDRPCLATALRDLSSLPDGNSRFPHRCIHIDGEPSREVVCGNMMTALFGAIALIERVRAETPVAASGPH